VRVSDVQPTSVRLSWSYDGDVSSDVQYYVIQYKPKAATWDYKEISGAITNFYDIRGLRWGGRGRRPRLTSCLAVRTQNMNSVFWRSTTSAVARKASRLWRQPMRQV
jgi:hypothetical protein